MSEEKQSSILILSAPKGDVRAARGLLGRALRKGLGIRSWNESPHFVSYQSSADVDGLPPRFTFWATEEEFDNVLKVAAKLAKAEGWSGVPVDAYYESTTYRSNGTLTKMQAMQGLTAAQILAEKSFERRAGSEGGVELLERAVSMMKAVAADYSPKRWPQDFKDKLAETDALISYASKKHS